MPPNAFVRSACIALALCAGRIAAPAAAADRPTAFRVTIGDANWAKSQSTWQIAGNTISIDGERLPAAIEASTGGDDPIRVAATVDGAKNRSVYRLRWIGEALLGTMEASQAGTGATHVVGIHGWRQDAQAPAQELRAVQDAIALRRLDGLIPRLRGLIGFDRNDLPVSVPAVLALVQVCQLRRDDPAIQQRYPALIGTYLSAVPPLDGASLPDPAQVAEDLLWKSWDGQPQRVRWTGEAEVTMAQDGGRQKRGIYIKLRMLDDGRMRLLPGHDRKDRKAMLDALHGDPIVGTMQISDGLGSCFLHIRAEDGERRVRSPLTVAATVRLSQPLATTVQKLPVAEGTTWKAGSGTARIASVTASGSNWLVVIEEPSGNRGSSITAGGGDREFLDENGKSMFVGSMSSDDDGKASFAHYRLAKRPASILVTTIDRISTREIPVRVEGIPLP